jgi:hypothetical protein
VKTVPILLASLLLTAPLARAQSETYGTIKATTKLRADGSKSTTIVDPEKHTAVETISDAGGKPMRKITYLLGDSDLALGAIYSDGKGKVIYQESYKRDAYGHIIESSFASPEGKYLGKRLFIYGTGNGAPQIEDYDANGQLMATPGATAKPAKKRR